MTKMCGYFDATGDAEVVGARLRSMAEAMKRAPEGSEESVILGTGGLVLIGGPPMDGPRLAWNGDRSVCAALCGHVVDPTGGAGTVDDAGPLLRAAAGSTILPQDLNGVFTVAGYDAAGRSLTVANDRYGLMPLYYYHDGATFAFASEAKALLRVAGRRELDWEACADFFYAGQVMGRRTLFRNIHAVEPGEALTYRDGRLRREQYHDFTQTPVLDRAEVSTGRLASLFKEAVGRRLRPGATNTLLLSGGFDSRLILGAMVDQGASPRVVSLENATGTQGEDDGKYAALMARHLGLECDFRRTREDFFASRDCVEAFHVLDGMVPAWGSFMVEVYPELDGGMGAVWDGLGMGIVLGSQHQVKGGDEAFLKKFALRRGFNRPLLALALKPRYFRLMDGGFTGRLRAALARIPASENRYQNFLLANRTRRRIAPISYGLFADKVQPVTPAADTDFLDYVLGIPHGLKANHGLYTDLMKEHFPSLTGVPVTSSGAIWRFEDDGSVSKRPTEQAPPTRSRRMLGRARKALRIGARVTTLDRYAVGRGGQPRVDKQEATGLIVHVLEKKLFDRPFYNTRLLRRMFAAYRGGNEVYQKLFLMVFYLELWHLLFVDGYPPAALVPGARADAAGGAAAESSVVAASPRS